MRLPPWLGPLVLVALVTRGVPAAATTANEVCSGDPCVLAHGVTVTPGSVLDFGARAFRITQAGGLFAGEGDTLVVRAGSVVMEPGAIIRGPLVPSTGVQVRIETTEDIAIQRNTRSRARIDAHGQATGGVIVLDAGGNIDLGGDLRVDGTTADGAGGTVDLDTTRGTGALTMTGDVNASGGLANGGGRVVIQTAGALVAGGMDLSGGSDGGSIDMTSGTTLTVTGVLNVAGTAAGAAGGDVTLGANGSVLIGARIAAQGGALSLADDGFGGDVDVSADGNVQVNERIDVFGGGPGGEAGFVTITAGADLTVTQPISAHGPGTTAGGGSVDLVAGGVLTLDALIDVHGSTAGGVSGQGGSEVRARGEINAEGEAGEIDLTTLSISGTQVPGPVTVTGNLHARGPGGVSGTISLQGCDVTVDVTGRLGTAGSGALNWLRSSRQMTIAGQVIAGPPGSNRFEFRTPPGLVPVITPGAIVQPPSTPQTKVSLLPCREPTPAVCGNGMTESGESCDDGNTTACDGCSATCVPEACGNSMVECAEACDDGNVADGDGCDANCTVTGCGNGRVTGTEQCDDGNTTAGDGCSSPDCQIEAPPGCGNGMTDPGEECDDNNTNDCDGCSHTCLTEACGNNRVECAEVCDEGNALDCDGDGCGHDCRSEEICGDGTVQCQEQCDAGPANSGPGVGCDLLCHLCALGSGDCPCGADTDCHQLGRCGGFACVDGLCASVTPPVCTDNNVCNGVESCANGACVLGTPLQCADADPCTSDSCDRRAGCQHALATGVPSASCRVEAFRLALDAASPDQVPPALRRRLDKAAGKLQLAVDAAAGGGDNPKRFGRLLRRVEKRAKKVLTMVAKAARKNQLPAALADTLRVAADGALAAAQGLRRDLPT